MPLLRSETPALIFAICHHSSEQNLPLSSTEVQSWSLTYSCEAQRYLDDPYMPSMTEPCGSTPMKPFDIAPVCKGT